MYKCANTFTFMLMNLYVWLRVTVLTNSCHSVKWVLPVEAVTTMFWHLHPSSRKVSSSTWSTFAARSVTFWNVGRSFNFQVQLSMLIHLTDQWLSNFKRFTWFGYIYVISDFQLCFCQLKVSPRVTIIPHKGWWGSLPVHILARKKKQ